MYNIIFIIKIVNLVFQHITFWLFFKVKEKHSFFCFFLSFLLSLEFLLGHVSFPQSLFFNKKYKNKIQYLTYFKRLKKSCAFKCSSQKTKKKTRIIAGLKYLFCDSFCRTSSYSLNRMRYYILRNSTGNNTSLFFNSQNL